MFAPENPTVLATVAANKVSIPHLRNEALAGLQSFHVRTAHQVAQVYAVHSLEMRDDLVQHINLQLWRGRFDSNRGDYAPWCWRVMRNRLFDLIRKRKTLVHSCSELALDDPLVVLSQKADWLAPFSHADLARILGWKQNSMRILLLTRSLLWVKATAQWQEWALACGIRGQFPDAGYEDWPTKKRHTTLAAALKIQLNTLHQYWKRWRRLLLELDYVRELCDGREGVT